MTVLRDVLDEQQDEERRTAVRALLRHPLLTPRGPDARAFGLVRKHAGWLADWFGREAGWSVYTDSGVARLRKVPARHDDRTRAAGAKPFGRRRYVLACLALAALERAETQVTLGWLVDRILAFSADEDLAAAGVVFTLESREQRADLVAVARLLLEVGVLTKVAGDDRRLSTVPAMRFTTSTAGCSRPCW